MLKTEKSDEKKQFYCIFLNILSPKTGFQMKSFIFEPSPNLPSCYSLACVFLSSWMKRDSRLQEQYSICDSSETLMWLNAWPMLRLRYAYATPFHLPCYDIPTIAPKYVYAMLGNVSRCYFGLRLS